MKIFQNHSNIEFLRQGQGLASLPAHHGKRFLIKRVGRDQTQSQRGGLFLLVLLLTFLVATPLTAQTVIEQPPLAPPSPSKSLDPSEDILIDGIGFAKLIMELAPTEKVEENTLQGHLQTMLEKNLCWSGVFNLVKGQSRFCGASPKTERVDMRLVLQPEAKQLIIRLVDSGPEKLLLFEETLPLDQKTPEASIMALVNRLTERVTGQAGVLGTAIAFVLRQPGYAKVIVATDTHATSIRPVSYNRGINLLPKWAPDGTGMIYTILQSAGTQVFFHNFGKNGSTVGRSRLLTPNGTLNTGGSFSPDGQNLVVTMSVDQSADLYSISLKNNKATRLTFRSGIETQADWSPDGKKIVFVSDRSGTPQVYLLDMETGEDLRLTFDGVYNADPKWSPDGKSILFTKRVERRDQIHIMDQFGENVRQVTRGRFDAEQAVWAPDGRQISFTSNRTGVYKIYLVSTDGTGLRRLTSTGKRFEESSPSWSRSKLDNR